MNKGLFWFLFILILVFALGLRLIPPQNHNFFFTIDQADDGVWAREIFERGQIVWRGAQTNIPGVYAGPLWYYFISIGFLLFKGDPFGGLFMVISLNVSLVGFLMWILKKEVGAVKALSVGFLLQFFWWFYDTSRWAFNPFPLVSCATTAVLLLSIFLKTKKKKYLYFASIPVFLGFNAEVAGATAIFLFYLAFGAWAFWKKKVDFKTSLVVFGLPTSAAAVLFFQLAKRYLGNQVSVLPGASTGYFSGVNYSYLSGRFAELFSYAVFPYHVLLSLLVFGLVFYLFWRTKAPSVFVKNFVLLTLGLFTVSFLMFGATKGWYDWQTVYLPPLLFISFVLLLLSIPKRYGLTVLAVVMVSQIIIFKERYAQYLAPQKGSGVLSTQMKVLDWIYTHAENDGFNAFTYLPSRRDYPYQYDFWWYGRRRYGFVPCQYSIHPDGLKLYVPHKDSYSAPTLGCDRLRFLIIEPEHGKDEIFDEWLVEVTEGTVFLETTDIDGVVIEKRRLKRKEEL